MMQGAGFPTMETNSNVPPTQRQVKNPIQSSVRFSAQQIAEINEIRVKERALYYFGRFWIVGGITWLLFIGMFGLQFAPEFRGVRADYPWFFFIAFFLVGILIVWAVIALHPLLLEDEDTYLWKKVNTVAKDKHDRYKEMADDDFSELMQFVGMRGVKEEDQK